MKNTTLNIRRNDYLNLAGFENSGGLVGLLFILLISITSINAQGQNLQTHLEKATQNLVNPIYAIIEKPLENGEIEYIKVYKNEKILIQTLDQDYIFIKNDTLSIDEIVWFKQSLIENSEPLQRKVEVVLGKDVETTLVEIMTKAPSMKIEVVPAEYETVTGRVLAKTYCPKLITVPAEYKIVYDTILIKTARKELITCPAVYETVTETIEVSPGGQKWVKKRTNGCQSKDCEIWILIEYPPRYETITKTVLISYCCPKEITIPAEYEIVPRKILVKMPMTKEVPFIPEYQTITKRVVKTPATTKILEIPAEYDTLYEIGVNESAIIEAFQIPIEYQIVTKSVIKMPSNNKIIEIPAEYKTVTKQVLITEAKNNKPAQYETITEWVLIKPSSTRIEVVPSPREIMTEVIPVTTEFDTLKKVQIQTTDWIKIYQPKTKKTVKKAASNIQVFPNPTSDILKIESKEGIEEVTIYQVNGQIVFHKFLQNENNTSLNVQDLPNGNYLMKIKTKTGTQTKKFIKQ